MAQYFEVLGVQPTGIILSYIFKKIIGLFPLL